MTVEGQKNIAKTKVDAANASIDQQIVRLEERAYDKENPPSPQEKKELLERIKFLNTQRKIDPMAGFGGLQVPGVDPARVAAIEKTLNLKKIKKNKKKYQKNY